MNNWATCDSMKPKVLKKDMQKLLLHIYRWINSKEVYTVRYGINMLMSFYLDEHFDENHLMLICNIKSDEYYVKMVVAWYFATALDKNYDDAIGYITSNCLDEWTHNKAIQKAVESRRISEKTKK